MSALHTKSCCLICFIFSFLPFEIPQGMPLVERHYMSFDGSAFSVTLVRDLTCT